MATIKHIALTTENPGGVSAFYKNAFKIKKFRRNENGAMPLSNKYINLAILNWKTEKHAMVGPNGPPFYGMYHIGFQVEARDQD